MIDASHGDRAMSNLIRPLRAVANGGSGDINLLAARAADRIEKLEAALVRISTFGNTGHGPHELAGIAAKALANDLPPAEIAIVGINQ
jgi:hypothetical protein